MQAWKRKGSAPGNAVTTFGTTIWGTALACTVSSLKLAANAGSTAASAHRAGPASCGIAPAVGTTAGSNQRPLTCAPATARRPSAPAMRSSRWSHALAVGLRSVAAFTATRSAGHSARAFFGGPQRACGAGEDLCWRGARAPPPRRPERTGGARQQKGHVRASYRGGLGQHACNLEGGRTTGRPSRARRNAPPSSGSVSVAKSARVRAPRALPYVAGGRDGDGHGGRHQSRVVGIPREPRRRLPCLHEQCLRHAPPPSRTRTAGR